MTNGRRAFGFALALLMAGCRRKTPAAPPAQAPAVDTGAKVAVPPPVGVRRDVAVDAGTPARAFLMRFGDSLLPMVCHEGGRFTSHEACYGHLPPVADVEVNNAYPRDARGRSAVRGTFQCPPMEDGAYAFVLRPRIRPPGGASSNGDPGPMDGWAVWPKGAFDVALTAFGRAAIQRGISVRAALTSRIDGDTPRNAARYRGQPLDAARAALVRHALGSAVGGLETDGGEPPVFSLLASIDIDLDGDGNRERIENVAVAGPEDDRYFLLRDDGRAMTRLSLKPDAPTGEAGPSTDGAVIGTFDLDGDGVPELWLETPTEGMSTWEIARPTAGALQRLARVSCFRR